MSKEPKRNVYVGHRYVPKIMGEWDSQETYEGLSIVTHQGTSYTSKKRVPVGIDITNEEYWVVTGNYNAQIEQYRQDVRNMEDRVLNEMSDTVNTVENTVTDLTNYVNNSIDDLTNYVNNSIDDVNNSLNDKTDLSLFESEINRTDNRLDEIGLNIKEYGAVGNANYYNEADGNWYEDSDFTIPATDDSEVIKTLLNLIKTNQTLSRTIYIPKGNYLIDSEIMIDDWNIKIVGDGGQNSRLNAGKNINRAMFISLTDERINKAGTGLRDVVFEGLYLFGSRLLIDGFRIAGFTRGCKILNCRISHFGRNQIVMNGSWSFIIDGNYISGVSPNHVGNGIKIGRTNEPDLHYISTEVNIPTITNNHIVWCKVGLEWGLGAGGIIEGNDFENNDRHLILQQPRGFNFTGNYFEKGVNTSNHLIIGSTDNNVNGVNSCVFDGNYFATNTKVFIYGLKNSSFKYNHFQTTNYLTIASSTLEERIAGNDFMIPVGTNEGTPINRETNNVREIFQ